MAIIPEPSIRPGLKTVLSMFMKQNGVDGALTGSELESTIHNILKVACPKVYEYVGWSQLGFLAVGVEAISDDEADAKKDEVFGSVGIEYHPIQVSTMPIVKLPSGFAYHFTLDWGDGYMGIFSPSITEAIWAAVEQNQLDTRPPFKCGIQIISICVASEPVMPESMEWSGLEMDKAISGISALSDGIVSAEDAMKAFWSSAEAFVDAAGMAAGQLRKPEMRWSGIRETRELAKKVIDNPTVEKRKGKRNVRRY